MTLAIRLARFSSIYYNDIYNGCGSLLLRQTKSCNRALLNYKREYTLPNGAAKESTETINARESRVLPPKDISPPIETGSKPRNLKSSNWSSTQNPCEEAVPRSDDDKSSSEVVKTKQKLSREVVRENVKGYVFTRYFDYVKNYDKVLEKNFPSAVKVYRVFFDGVKYFYTDMKRFLKISRIVKASPEGFRALNRKELELYVQLPRDMLKVAPALIGSSLPFVGYVFFPIVFMYPRQFLTSHFWTIQQRAEFQQLALQDRLRHNRAVFRCLQSKLKSSNIDMEQRGRFENLLGLIGSGFHPSVDNILEVQDIFAEQPYDYFSLSGKHVKLLCQMHGVPRGFFKRTRLYEYAFMVHFMDLAILREGGVHNMTPEAMRYSCYIRGLNPSNLRNEEMIDWLRNWIHISTTIEKQHISLFMHLPLFLSYNHPNNWKLVYNSSNNSTSTTIGRHN